MNSKEDEQIWRDQVNDRLASLTASEVVQNDRLDSLHEIITDMKNLWEGVPDDKNDNGIKGDLRELSVSINRLNSALCLDITGSPGSDFTGRPGPLKKIELMWDGIERREKQADRRWKGLVTLAVAIVSTVGLLITNLDRLEPYLRKTVPVEKKVTKKKRVVRSTETSHRLPDLQSEDDGAMD